MINEELISKASESIEDKLRNKEFYMIGYPDVWGFDTINKLKKYGICNSIWFIEFPKSSEEVFKKYSGKDFSEYGRMINDLMESTDLRESICKNVAGILYFEPYLMIPCGPDSSDEHERDEGILKDMLEGLNKISEYCNRNDFDSIAAFIGGNHAEYVIELNEEKNFLNGLRIKKKIFNYLY